MDIISFVEELKSHISVIRNEVIKEGEIYELVFSHDNAKYQLVYSPNAFHWLVKENIQGKFHHEIVGDWSENLDFKGTTSNSLIPSHYKDTAITIDMFLEFLK